MNEQKNQDLIPIEEAARLLGTTPVNVLMNLKRGLLQGAEVEGSWFVSQASIAAHAGDTKAALAKPHCQREGCGGCGEH